ncbi:hypothetical protein T07_2600 [Trichinella nelsoni]|uniref:Uncharacterized protein n=2 Tax=Trichinella TaxID=6333 RepID=A0A0V0S7E3_9BILA|nr:hypothetical protein T07_2600 [Trichinella nelsoni]
MSVTGILQSHNRTPKCLSLLKSCTRLFQHDIGKLLLAREHFYTTTFDTFRMAMHLFSVIEKITQCPSMLAVLINETTPEYYT